MLRWSHLQIGHGQNPILKLEDKEFSAGAQILVRGPSGSGKTTLLYTLAGLMPAVGGEIWINNTELPRLKEDARDRFRGKNIGIIFQTLQLVKSLTVLDNLLLASFVAGLKQDAQAARAALEKLGLGDKADFLPEKLSQGQAQRVAFARAVQHKPSLILADEPTSSLDDESCAVVVQLMRQMAHETNAILVVSTHDHRVGEQFDCVLTTGGTYE